MKERPKIFLLLSAVLLYSIILYIRIYAQIDQQRLVAELKQAADQAEQDSTAMRML